MRCQLCCVVFRQIPLRPKPVKKKRAEPVYSVGDAIYNHIPKIVKHQTELRCGFQTAGESLGYSSGMCRNMKRITNAGRCTFVTLTALTFRNCSSTKRHRLETVRQQKMAANLFNARHRPRKDPESRRCGRRHIQIRRRLN